MRQRQTSNDNPFAHMLQNTAAPVGAYAWKPTFGLAAPEPAAEAEPDLVPNASESVVEGVAAGVVEGVVEGPSGSVSAEPEEENSSKPKKVEEEQEDVFGRRLGETSSQDGVRNLVLSVPEKEKLFLVLTIPTHGTYSDPVSVFEGNFLVASNISLAKLLSQNPWILESRSPEDFVYGQRVQVRKALNIPADPNTLIRACHVKDLI